MDKIDKKEFKELLKENNKELKIDFRKEMQENNFLLASLIYFYQ